MSLLRTVLAFSAGKIPSEWLCNFVKPVIIHPFYHTVSDEYLPHIHPIYTPKNRLEFAKEIDFLSRHFEPMDISMVYSYVKQRALPLLYQKGIPATIFINTAFIDNKNLFYRYKAALLVDKMKKKNLLQP
jgi:hypothetical protein